MALDDEISFHSGRALAELDLARRCHDSRAAKVHLALAERHLERMRSLCSTMTPSAPRPA